MLDPDHYDEDDYEGSLHVAALLKREGRSLPVDREVRKSQVGGKAKVVGFGAGAMLVAGAFAASALGLTGAPDAHGDAAEPMQGGAGHGVAGGVTEYPVQQVNNTLPGVVTPAVHVADPAPQSDQDAASQADRGQAQAQHQSAAAAHQSGSTHDSAPTQGHAPEQQAPSAPAQPAPQQPAPKKHSSTLQDVLTPVTSTVDDTLQPALSLIPGVGGLLGG